MPIRKLTGSGTQQPRGDSRGEWQPPVTGRQASGGSQDPSGNSQQAGQPQQAGESQQADGDRQAAGGRGDAGSRRVPRSRFRKVRPLATGSAADAVAHLHEAKVQLSQEMEANLKQLKAILKETQRIAKDMEAVLEETRTAWSDKADDEQGEPGNGDPWRPKVRDRSHGTTGAGSQDHWQPPPMRDSANDAPSNAGSAQADGEHSEQGDQNAQGNTESAEGTGKGARGDAQAAKSDAQAAKSDGQGAQHHSKGAAGDGQDTRPDRQRMYGENDHRGADEIPRWHPPGTAAESTWDPPSWDPPVQ